MLQTWSESPDSIAGVTRSVLCTPAKLIVHEVQCNRVTVILKFLAKSTGQPRAWDRDRDRDRAHLNFNQGVGILRSTLKELLTVLTCKPWDWR
jgi:hypothetical protein